MSDSSLAFRQGRDRGEQLPPAPHLPPPCSLEMLVVDMRRGHRTPRCEKIMPLPSCAPRCSIPRVFPSWWWPCSPCKPCSGWQRRKGWGELSVLVGIPVVSSLLKPDYELSKCLIFPFTLTLSFLVITPTVYWVPTTWKTLCREFSLSQPSQFCQVSSICPFCRWETEGHGNEGIFSRWWQSMICRGGILAYMTTQSILFLPP